MFRAALLLTAPNTPLIPHREFVEVLIEACQIRCIWLFQLVGGVMIPLKGGQGYLHQPYTVVMNKHDASDKANRQTKIVNNTRARSQLLEPSSSERQLHMNKLESITRGRSHNCWKTNGTQFPHNGKEIRINAT